MQKFIVERTFAPPLTREQLNDTEARMKPCLDLYKVRWLRSYWSADRTRMICEYEAPDAESVREVQNQAGAKFDSVWLLELTA